MANYPGSSSTNTNLYLAVDSKSTSLTAGIDAVVTTIPVVSTTGFPSSGLITIDLEVISYTSIDATNFLGATRAAQGTSAASHASAAEVSHNVMAAHHNAVKDEVIAVEDDLVASLGTITPVTPAATATSIFQRFGHLVQHLKTLNDATSAWNSAMTWLSALNQAATPASTAASLKERLDQIVTQLKAITGTTNWYDTVVVSLINKLSLTGGTLSGDLSVSYPLSGNNTSSKVENTSNTANSHATFQAAVAGTSGGDPLTQYNIPSGSIWAAGVDNSDSDSYKVSQDAGLGTNDYLKISTAGLVTVANKITGLTNGSASSDAAAFNQIKYIQAPVQATTTTQFSTTSSTFQTTNLSASITPSSASNRIKITITGDLQIGAASVNVFLTVARSTTNLGASSGFASFLHQGTAAGTGRTPVAISYIDSPATTSSTTYNVQIRNSDNSTSCSFPSANVPTCVIILEEVV